MKHLQNKGGTKGFWVFTHALSRQHSASLLIQPVDYLTRSLIRNRLAIHFMVISVASRNRPTIYTSHDRLCAIDPTLPRFRAAS